VGEGSALAIFVVGVESNGGPQAGEECGRVTKQALTWPHYAIYKSYVTGF
jgi:hypothetical protein